MTWNSMTHLPAGVSVAGMGTEAPPSTIFPLPCSTPVEGSYQNLIESSQYARDNFRPTKRRFQKTLSGDENEAVLRLRLKQYWGHSAFRYPQLEICLSAMKDHDILVVAPTGLGKSVCFQVPAIVKAYGITLVVSPLLALMKDQVRSLQEKGLAAEMLCHETEETKRQEISRSLRMAHPAIRLLYVTPEMLFSKRVQADLQVAYSQRQLCRLVVDEAHVLEEWGLSFRPGYRLLKDFRVRFPDVRITALTASATAEIRADITRNLKLRRDNLAQWVRPFNRKNLFYEVRYRGSENAHKSKDEDIADFIITYRPEALRINHAHDIPSATICGLVYCRTRQACDDVARTLKARGVRAAVFYARKGNGRSINDEILAKWQSGEYECIVATIAFGMGIDQAHVRYVVHYDVPKSFEGFYQETGRAGRDGHMSRCVLYYSREDARSLRRMVESEVDKCANEVASKGQILAGEEEIAKAKTRCLNSFKLLQQYAESTSICRHISICRYFGETVDHVDATLKYTYCAMMCDVCTNQAAVIRRAANITEDIDVASQVVPPGPMPIQDMSLASDSAPTNTLDLLHQSMELPSKPAGSPDAKQLASSRGLSSRNVPRSSGQANSSNVEHSPLEEGFRGSDMRAKDVKMNDPRPARWRPIQLSVDEILEESPHAGPSRRRKCPDQGSPAPAVQLHVPLRDLEDVSAPTVGLSAGYHDDATSGTYALAGHQPLDPVKRQQAEDRFLSVEPETGLAGGPFAYYSARPSVVRSGKPNAFAGSFKTPFLQRQAKVRCGTIGAEHRKAALRRVKASLRTYIVDSPHADSLWQAWRPDDPPHETRKAIIRQAARDLERDLVRLCERHNQATPEHLERIVGALDYNLSVLLQPDMVGIISKGEFEAEFGQDADAEWVRMAERAIRGVTLAVPAMTAAAVTV